MHYLLRHITRFRYSAPVGESIMEVRMQPRSEGSQYCPQFTLRTTPRAHIFSYVDSLGNRVHHFDIPDRHAQLTIVAEALIETMPQAPLPERLGESSWDELARLTVGDDYFEWLMPSTFARPSSALQAFITNEAIERDADVLGTLHRIATVLHDRFDYVPQSTQVDSPIDDALNNWRGVCQDFTHIMIAIVRSLGIPCRYVSGYLARDRAVADRSSPDATHAWAEALVPGHGWVGFDPTNDLVAGERHIRVAIGRDYADVPPTRGTFRGHADTDLSVAVTVVPSDAPYSAEAPRLATYRVPATEPEESPSLQPQQQ